MLYTRAVINASKVWNLRRFVNLQKLRNHGYFLITHNVETLNLCFMITLTYKS